MRWWHLKGLHLWNLDPDVICLYARLMWQSLSDRERSEPAPDFLIDLIVDYSRSLPRLHAERLLFVVASGKVAA